MEPGVNNSKGSQTQSSGNEDKSKQAMHYKNYKWLKIRLNQEFSNNHLKNEQTSKMRGIYTKEEEYTEMNKNNRGTPLHSSPPSVNIHLQTRSQETLKNECQ